jgi:hypothetical protein
VASPSREQFPARRGQGCLRPAGASWGSHQLSVAGSLFVLFWKTSFGRVPKRLPWEGTAYTWFRCVCPKRIEDPRLPLLQPLLSPSFFCLAAPRLLGLNTWPRVFVCRVHSSRSPTEWAARVTQPLDEEKTRAKWRREAHLGSAAGTPFFSDPELEPQDGGEEFRMQRASNHSVMMAAVARGSVLLPIRIHHGATNRRKRSNSDESNRSGERGASGVAVCRTGTWLSTCDGRRLRGHLIHSLPIWGHQRVRDVHW